MVTLTGAKGFAPTKTNGDLPVPIRPGPSTYAERVDEEIRALWTRANLAVVRVASDANVDFSTDLEAGDVLNGVTLATGNLVFLPAQTDPSENGIYIVPASGAASRASGYTLYNQHPGLVVIVSDGTFGIVGGAMFRCSSLAGGTIDVTALEFEQLNFGGDISIEGFGAVSDAVGPVACAISSTVNPTRLTRSSGTWTTADIGKLIVVAGAGAAGAALCTTIATIFSSTVAVLSDAASTTQASTSCWYGTDNAGSINGAWALARVTGGKVKAGPGTFATGRLTFHDAIGVIFEGAGKQSGAGPTDYGTHLWPLTDLNANNGNAIDFTGNAHCALKNFQLGRGDLPNYINVGILNAGKSGAESIANSFEDLLVFGSFLKGGIYQYGVPNCVYRNCQSYTYASDANAYGAQFTCNNHASVTSAVNTLNTGPVDTSNIYQENCHWIEFAVPNGTSSSRGCRINGVDGFEFTNGFLGSTLSCLHVKDTSSNWGSRNVEIRNTTLQGFPLGGGLYGTPTQCIHFDSAQQINGFAVIRCRANEASTAHNTTNAGPSTAFIQFAATPPKVVGLRIEGAPQLAVPLINGGSGTGVVLDGAHIEANGNAINEPGSVVRSRYVNAGTVTPQSGGSSARYGRSVQKAGSAGGNYTSTATSATDVDGTNLSFTTIIPTGMSLLVTARAAVNNGTAGNGANVYINDSVAGLVDQQDITSPANGQIIPVPLHALIPGDDASHTITLQWSRVTGGTMTMRNASAADKPKMTFTFVDSA